MDNAYLAEDLSSGYASRVVGVRVIDGFPGWAVVVMATGETFAYAPDLYMGRYGEIAREL